MSAAFDDLSWRGLVYQVTDPIIEQKINDGGLTIYIGFDPTADSLHIGHLLQLTNLRRLQQAGHRPIVLAGGATGMIGDPSFKSSERSLLDTETIAHNVRSVEPQLRQFLDFTGDNGALLVNNYDWTHNVSVIDFLRDIGKHFTVNSLIARESVRARLNDREQGISYTEFSYSLLQSFDFLHLFRTHGCTLQMGASDQWGNIVSGVDLVRRTTGSTVYGLCTPLVTKADGTKFGKTESGTVWLDRAKTSPYSLYQFFIRSEDAKVVDYLKYFTFLSRERIDELQALTETAPQRREGQRALAWEVTALVHGEAEAERARRAAGALFTEEVRSLDEELLLEVCADAPSAVVPRSALGEVNLVDLLVRLGLVTSKSAARTAISQGGVSINNVKEPDPERRIGGEDLLHDTYAIVRRGKKDFAVARFSG